jgi:hypothetical protein
VPGALTSLPQLAARINDAHQAVLRHLAASLESARDAGELLLSAKDRVKHGSWLFWLEKNCECSERSARLYMAIAKNWEQIAADPQFSTLTLQEAAALGGRPARRLIEGPSSNRQPVADLQTRPTEEAGPDGDRHADRGRPRAADGDVEVDHPPRRQSDPDVGHADVGHDCQPDRQGDAEASNPAGLPRWVKTARDDGAQLRAVWSRIHDAYDAALEGDVKSAAEDLTFLWTSEMLDEYANPSISRLWHTVVDSLECLIGYAVDELEGDIATKVAKHGHLTPAVEKGIRKMFDAMLKKFTHDPRICEWAGHWEEERDEEADPDPTGPAADAT